MWAVDVWTSEFLSTVSTSVLVNVTRVNIKGDCSVLPEYCRASVPATHPPKRLYFSPSNAHLHVPDEDHVAIPTHNSPHPQSLCKAMNNTNAPKWKVAMERELKTFRRLNVMEMCMLPHGMNCISCKWLFITKYNSDETLNKHKSRLVDRGFSQVYVVDFNETFAPRATMATLRIFIALANQYGYHCHSCDIETAFLHAILTEECYMEIPLGYVRRKGEHGNCMRLKKVLYILKQGFRKWNHVLVTFLTEKLGFHQLLSEQSVFTQGSRDQYIAITVHVDDESIISPNESSTKDLKARLKIEYGIKIWESGRTHSDLKSSG